MKKIFAFIFLLIILSSLVSSNETEKQLCKDIYYLVISTDYGYTETQLQNISSKFEVSINVTKDYISNYEELCLLKGYSDSLPKQNFQKIILNNSEEFCDLKLNSFFELSFPFFETYLGSAECEGVKFWNNFVKIEKFEDNFKISGVRVYLVFILLLVIVIVLNVKKKK